MRRRVGRRTARVGHRAVASGISVDPAVRLDRHRGSAGAALHDGLANRVFSEDGEI
ncbi:hypothetical protein EDD34_0177 [Myceligenerans xiligouense]|uniref:Uncharacterized protein n=1 Tax=Myceligenerans xiligouense TaxID=253184 RepID=A0A3N4Z3C7_9MICO|nr:hypothetical protein EDD34_0177 [Myceligenerans xiligouense]